MSNTDMGPMPDDAYDDLDEIDDGDDDGLDEANCGMMRNGQCSLAGTEYCDWSCRFTDGAAHNRSHRRRDPKPLPLFEGNEE